MAHWKERFLGITELPKELSPLEIEEFFTLSPTDLKAITEQFRPKYRIAGTRSFSGCPGHHDWPGRLRT